MPSRWNAIYLGNSASFMDPFEGDSHAENAASFVGNSYGSAGDPLFGHILKVTARNTGGQRGALDSNNSRAQDEISYDLGSGEQNQVFDTAVTFHATLTYTDGSQANVTAGIMQDVSGNLFLVPSTSARSPSTQAYESKAIQSIQLDSLHNDNWGGLYTSRHDTGFVCFADGTLIATPHGPRPVEDLGPGDLVQTLDHGAQPILWAGGQTVLARGPGRAYRLARDALGPGLPDRDLTLSAQHRVMLRSGVAARMTGTAEVLVAATRLAGMRGIGQRDGIAEMRYHHILCARHELVRANGAWCETLLPGPQATDMLGPQAMSEIAACHPGWQAMQPARPIVDGARCRQLLQRHRRNGKPLVLAAHRTGPPRYFRCDPSASSGVIPA